MRLSALYCTKQEEEFIELSIQTVLPFVDEVIVFDTKSSDRTVEIVKALGVLTCGKVKLIQHDKDFDEGCEYATRNIALQHCTGDWIVVLDADQFLSDGWRDAIQPFLLNPKCECVGINYEHWVGSCEYVHNTDVPAVSWIFFKRTKHLKCRAAAEVCSWAKEQHHASFERSCSPGSLFTCTGATVFHAGFIRRDMHAITIYRAHRGDYGHEPERKLEVQNAIRLRGPWQFIGTVKRVNYGADHLPSAIRHWFNNSYRLKLADNGQILSRTLISTGEKC